MEEYGATESNLMEMRDNYDKRDKQLEHNRSIENLPLVVFSHGKESGPNGTKIQCLMAVAEELGMRTISVDYRNCAIADDRVALLTQTINGLGVLSQQLVLVGSSMGGYVSTVVANEMPVTGLFLMAPALWMPAEEYSIQSYHPLTTRVEITHGLNDDIVPYENSIRFLREHANTILHLVPDDHRLKASHDFLTCQFKRFLEELN